LLALNLGGGLLGVSKLMCLIGTVLASFLWTFLVFLVAVLTSILAACTVLYQLALHAPAALEHWNLLPRSVQLEVEQVRDSGMMDSSHDGAFHEEVQATHANDSVMILQRAHFTGAETGQNDHNGFYTIQTQTAENRDLTDTVSNRAGVGEPSEV
jgi:hypothetical protein